MDAQIETHLPLITHRITFAPKAFPLPAMITARMEFPAVTISPRDLTPPPTPDPKTATKHGAMARREKTPNRQNGQETSVRFDDRMDIRHLSPLTEESEEETSDYDRMRRLRNHVVGLGAPEVRVTTCKRNWAGMIKHMKEWW
jgi:hypothetical protein